MQSNPRILVNLLVVSVKLLVNLLVKLTESGQGGGHRGLGLPGMDDLSIPRPSWACTGAPDQLSWTCWRKGTMGAMGTMGVAKEKH